MAKAVHLEPCSLFRPTAASWKQTQTQCCSIVDRQPLMQSLILSIYITRLCPLRPQCKQIPWSTVWWMKEWWMKAYLPVLSNYPLPPELQSMTLQTNCVIVPMDITYWFFYFFVIIHSALKSRERGSLQGSQLGGRWATERRAVLEGTGLRPAAFGFAFGFLCLSLLNPSSLPLAQLKNKEIHGHCSWQTHWCLNRH